MNLVKTSFYTSISQALSIIAGFISIKVVAAKIGPAGMGMMGQYLNVTTLLALFATGTIGTGVVKYLAQFTNDKPLQVKVIATASRITIVCSLVIGCGGVIMASYLSEQTFKTNSYYLVYVLWGCFLTFSAFSTLFSNILNGLKLIPYLTIVNISGTLLGLIVTVYLANKYGVFGVLIAANFTSFLLFSLHLFFLDKYKWFSYKVFFQPFDKEIGKLLSGFVLMAIASGVFAPLIQLVVRDHIIKIFSFNEAGYWQSVTRISDVYLAFFTSVIGIYYLPRLSEIATKKELKAEIWKMYKTILPAIIGVSFMIWLSRFMIIDHLLTPKFLPSASLYAYQFIGDVFKIAAWLLAYVMLAKAMKYRYIINEIVFSISYVLLCYFFISKFGLIGAMMGFMVNNIIFWIVMCVFMRGYLRR